MRWPRGCHPPFSCSLLSIPQAARLQPGTGTGTSQGSQHAHGTSLQSQIHMLLTNQFRNLLVINPTYQFFSLFLNVIKLFIYMCVRPLSKAKGQIRGRQGRHQALAWDHEPQLPQYMPSPNATSLCDFRWFTSSLSFQEG